VNRRDMVRDVAKVVAARIDLTFELLEEANLLLERLSASGSGVRPAEIRAWTERYAALIGAEEDFKQAN